MTETLTVTRRRCQHCGGSIIMEGDSDDVRLVIYLCLACGREVGERREPAALVRLTKWEPR